MTDDLVEVHDELPPEWLADVIASSRADLATIPVTSRPTWIRHLLLEPVDSTAADAVYNPDVWELQRRLNLAADALTASQDRIASLERLRDEHFARRPLTLDEIHEIEAQNQQPVSATEPRV